MYQNSHQKSFCLFLLTSWKKEGLCWRDIFRQVKFLLYSILLLIFLRHVVLAFSCIDRSCVNMILCLGLEHFEFGYLKMIVIELEFFVQKRVLERLIFNIILQFNNNNNSCLNAILPLNQTVTDYKLIKTYNSFN